MVKNIFFTSAFLLLLTFGVIAQEQKLEPVEEGFGVSERPLNCETTFQRMEIVRRLIQTGTNEKSVLILIARRGSEEKSRTLNRRRLANVRKGLQVTLGIVKPIVVAEGKQASGFGRVEVFFDGKLIGAFLARKNSAIIKCDM
ncbi:MAG TPA: hypothetical protein VF596_11575 [Pyrinomonadaceae bacterium]|jgi:hypothetical protein